MADAVNILIVDDDRATQRMLADALTKQGFTVTVERDGDWAVKTFEKKRFDAVLLDLLLPALNGYEVAKKMRELPRGRSTPIVMISGVYKNAIHQREAVEKHGAFAFIEKPMRLSTLFEVLQQALGEKYPSPQEAAPAAPPARDDEVTGEHLADAATRDEVTHVESQTQRAEAQTSAGPSLAGDVSRRPFAELLAEIYRWRGTGALLLKRDKVKKIIYFRSGMAQSVKSNLLSECLGRIMVREKMISEAECEESLKRMKSTHRQQGTVLIDMGCISPHNLQHALQVQLQVKLFDLFSWDNGDFQFNSRVDPVTDPVELGMTCAETIYEGVKKTYDRARLAHALSGTQALFVHPSEHPLYGLQDAGLGDEERQLLEQVDGHKTVATLRALSILPPLETDRFLFAMRCAQMLELRDYPAEGRARQHVSVPSRPRAQGVIGEPPPLPPRPSGAKSMAPATRAPELELPWSDAKVSVAPAEPTEAKRPKPTKSSVSLMARSAGSLLPELSTVVGARALAGEESLLRERLAGKAAALRKLDYFEVLGVATDASREEIKRAYFAMAKEYHPDKHFGSASAEIRQLAQQIYDLISTAHDTLTDSSERERYLRELAQGKKREMGDEVGKILAAEGKFQKGEELMRQRQYAQANALFRDAIALYADEGEFHAWHGWSLFQMGARSDSEIENAVASLETAISLNPRLDKGYLFLGYIFKASGRPDKAEKQFEKAIQCNPDCTEALRELRLLGKSR